MTKTRLSQLEEAKRTKQLVYFKSTFEDSPVRGYVLDVGPKFFLLATVSDRIWFDGFECFRAGDIRGLREDPYVRFTEAALEKRRERRPRKPRVRLTSIEELLLSAGRLFPLVTIARDRIDPDVCWIGRVLSVERGRVSLLEISPDAIWEEKPDSYLIREITRVSFGADYEAALHLVGGDPTGAIKKVRQSSSSGASRR